MRQSIIFAILFFYAIGCQTERTASNTNPLPGKTFLVVLGIAQDAGFPQAACQKACCQFVWENWPERKMVSCLAIVDSEAGKAWLFDATPDFKDQLYRLENIRPEEKTQLAGIFLTHAHIGHYTGLMQLGREAMGAKNMLVYAMPRMKRFLENSGPWSQLVGLNNIELRPLKSDSTIVLNQNIKVTPFHVPHRDEFSETVGFRIEGAEKTALFIPDIDKWNLWERDILEEIAAVDYAFLDGSFYQNGEIPGRDMSEIQHPFLEESMALFKTLSGENKAKIHFIHFNHTNPVLRKDSEARKHVLREGYKIADDGQILLM